MNKMKTKIQVKVKWVHQAVQAVEVKECKKLSQATGRLKGLVKKQLGLQESINETKEALRLLLGGMQSTMAAIAESQREVEEAKKELSAVVVEPGPPAPGPADMEIDELLGHIGVELTADQQAARSQGEESRKTRSGSWALPLPCRRARVT